MSQRCIVAALALAGVAGGCSASLEATAPEVNPAMQARAGVAPGTLIAGRALLTSRCIKCHGLEPIAAYTPDEWRSVVIDMQDEANLSELEIAQLTAYLTSAARFSP